MKIFCIGYPRTGTTSTINALKKLGYKIWHYQRKYYEKTVNALETGRFCDRILNNHDAFGDIPICIIYKNLDKLYPDSKFILIKREKESWFNSMQWLLNNKERKKYPNKHNDLLWSNIYPEMIEEHTKDVNQYFLNSDRLLVKDISEIGYDVLTDFLNIKRNMSKSGFPHVNRRR